MSSWIWRSYHAVQSVVAPEARNSQDYYAKALLEYIPKGVRWLDLGCGWRTLRAWLAEEEVELGNRSAILIGADPDVTAVRKNEHIHFGVASLAHALPFADASFDVVTANMVVEHLDDPRQDFREVCRVLRPGGLFLFVTPNLRGYLVRMAGLLPQRLRGTLVTLVEGRQSADRFNTYYRANSCEDVRSIASSTGFEVVECRHVLSSAEFARILPVAILELMWLRVLSADRMAASRPNLVCVLRRAVQQQASTTLTHETATT